MARLFVGETGKLTPKFRGSVRKFVRQEDAMHRTNMGSESERTFYKAD